MVRSHEWTKRIIGSQVLSVRECSSQTKWQWVFFSLKEGFRYSRSHSKELLLMNNRVKRGHFFLKCLGANEQGTWAGFKPKKNSVFSPCSLSKSCRVCHHHHHHHRHHHDGCCCSPPPLSTCNKSQGTWIKEIASSSQRDEQRYQIQGKSSTFSLSLSLSSQVKQVNCFDGQWENLWVWEQSVESNNNNNVLLLLLLGGQSWAKLLLFVREEEGATTVR